MIKHKNCIIKNSIQILIPTINNNIYTCNYCNKNFE